MKYKKDLYRFLLLLFLFISTLGYSQQQFPIYTWNVKVDHIYQEVKACGINTIIENMMDEGDREPRYFHRSKLLKAADSNNIDIISIRLNQGNLNYSEPRYYSTLDSVRLKAPYEKKGLRTVYRSFDAKNYGRGNSFIDKIITDDLNGKEHDLSYYYDLDNGAVQLNNSISIPSGRSGIVIEGPKNEYITNHYAAIRWAQRYILIKDVNGNYVKTDPINYKIGFVIKNNNLNLDPIASTLKYEQADIPRGTLKFEIVNVNDSNEIAEKYVSTASLKPFGVDTIYVDFKGDNVGFLRSNIRSFARITIIHPFYDQSIQLTKIIFVNEHGYKLIQGKLHANIIEEMNTFSQQASNANVNILGYYLDEPHALDMGKLKYLNDQYGNIISSSQKLSFLNESIAALSPNIVRYHYYPFEEGRELQYEIDFLCKNLYQVNWLCNVYYPENTQTYSSPIPFHHMIQTQNEETDGKIYRLPSINGIGVQVGLALAYGAKGIGYYQYRTKDKNGGCFVFDNRKDSIYEKNEKIYDKAKRINKKIQSIASDLLSLNWQRAYYFTSNSTKANIHGSGTDHISHIHNGDYIQVGNFTHGSDRYFMLVNRICDLDETQTFSVELSNSLSNNTAIQNIETGEYICSTSNSFQVALDSGDWDLFKITECPNEDCPENITLPNTTISSGATETHQASNTIENSTTYIIEDGGTVLLKGNEIILNPGFEAEEGSTFEATVDPCE